MKTALGWIVAAGLLCTPLATATAQNALWFPTYDASASQVGITKYDADGTVIVDVPLPAGGRIGYSAAMDYAQHVWITDNSSRAFKVDTNGSIVATAATDPSPQGVAVDANDNLFIVSRGSKTVKKYSPAGTLIATAATPKGCLSCVADANGDVWVPVFDVGAGNPIELYQFDNTLASAFTFTFAPVASGSFGLSGITVDTGGDLYVVNQDRASVMRVQPFGSKVWETALPPGYARGIAADASGNVWAAGHVGRHVFQLRTSDGALLASFATPNNSPLSGALLDPNGDVWSLGNVSPVINKWHRGDGTNTVQSDQRRGTTVMTGDSSGYHSFVVLNGNADFDGDSFSNRAEAIAGSSYLDTTSTPNKPTPIVSGQLTGGATTYLTFRHKASAGIPYAAGFSFNTSPGIPIPGVGTISLAFDPLFVISLQFGPPIFNNLQGVLDANGDALGSIVLPNGIPSNLTVYTAFVTYDGTGIRVISNAKQILTQ